MIWHVILLYYVGIVSASFQIPDYLLKSFGVDDQANQRELRRQPRAEPPPKTYKDSGPTCEELTDTSSSPFIALLLYKTSGRFLGMGSIIDKKSVITANMVVQSTMNYPRSLIILAGCRTPWWGKNSQVQHASDIYMIDVGITLVTLLHEFTFNKFVQPIKIASDILGDNFLDKYGKGYVAFGIQRTSWDSPGEFISKGSIYHMKLESIPQAQASCLEAYVDQDFNSSIMFCTYSNGSWNWGCMGSPTVALNPKDEFLQVGVIIKTTMVEEENFHFHYEIALVHQWIRAHSLLGYELNEE